MIYTKEEFKKLWEANEYGSGITFDDIADCAKAWGLFTMPKCNSIDLVTYKVLCAAECSDTEEWKLVSLENNLIVSYEYLNNIRLIWRVLKTN